MANKPITIGGILYPSQEWYDANITAKGKQAVGGREVAIKPAGQAVDANGTSVFVDPNAVASNQTTEIQPDQLDKTGSVALRMLPGTPPDLTKANGRLSRLETELKADAEAAAAARKKWEAEQEKFSEQQEEWWSDIQEQPTIEEKRQQEFEELGIKPEEYFKQRQAATAEVKSMLSEYNRVLAQKDAVLTKIEETPMLTDLKDIEKVKGEKDYNVQLRQISAGIEAKMAIMELEAGNFAEARNFVSQAVEDYIYDKNLQRQEFQTMKEEQAYIIAGLDDEYKNILEEAETRIEEAYQEEKERTEQIGDLMIDFPRAGIDLADTVIEAKQKARDYLGSQPMVVKAPTTREFAGKLYQWNEQTQNWELASGVSQSTAQLPTEIPGTELPESTLQLRSIINTLPVGQQEAAYGAVQSFKNAKDITDLLDKGVSTGPVAGRTVLGTLWGVIPGKQKLGLSSAEEDAFVAATTAFSANYIKSISGVAVSEKEMERLMNALPSIYKQESVNKNNLKMLMDTLRNKWELQLGINFDNYPFDIPQAGRENEVVIPSQSTLDYLMGQGYAASTSPVINK